MRTKAAAAALLSIVPWPASERPSVHTVAQQDLVRTPLDAASASVSDDGRYVAFTSYAALVPADTNDRQDVYVLDRSDGHVTLESVTAAGKASPFGSAHPRLSGDGRLLVYESSIPRPDAAPSSDIVLRDRRQGTLEAVSRGPGGERSNGYSTQPEISRDGRVIAFVSAATNLTNERDPSGERLDIFAFEIATRTMTRIADTSPAGPGPIGESTTPAISGDGRYIAFAAMAPSDSSAPTQAARRQFSQVFLHDRERGATTRVSVAPGGVTLDGGSWAPAISADGRYLAFVSAATNIAPGDTNRSADVFLADWQRGTMELVSRGSGGGAANGRSVAPALSADGRLLAFQSEASDLLCARRCNARTEDINLLWDVFVLDRQTGVTTRVSSDAAAGWLEPSVAPALGRDVVVFSSRHPIDASDTKNDFDLFVCATNSARSGTAGLLGQRPYGVDHRHQPHTLPH